MRQMKKGSSGLKIKPGNNKKQGNPPSRNINNMNGSVVSAQNPTKKYLIHSLSEVGKEQRAADEKRFSLIHDFLDDYFYLCHLKDDSYEL